MLLLIDNFDSFTYNLVQAFEILGQKVRVIRNHSPSVFPLLDEAQYLVIGPGPGHPEASGFSKECLERSLKKRPILGVCLGHQLIGHYFGAKVVKASMPMHGKTSSIFYQDDPLFKGLPQGFTAMRYHSLVIDGETVPSCLEVICKTSLGEIMGVKHKEDLLWGIQFHPESMGTPFGMQLLSNFLKSL